MYPPLYRDELADGKGTSVADLLRLIIEKTGYEEHLRKTQSDFDSRWENVQELVSLQLSPISFCLTDLNKTFHPCLNLFPHFLFSPSGDLPIPCQDVGSNLCQISYSVIVAEEQNRETNHEISEESFTPASAAMEAIANQAHKKEDKRLHPMFRRTSTSTSTSTNGLDDEKPRKRRKVGGGIKEEPIDLVDSDDDLDDDLTTKAKLNGAGRSASPNIDEEVKGDTAPVASGER
jgi:hypothetical protein